MGPRRASSQLEWSRGCHGAGLPVSAQKRGRVMGQKEGGFAVSDLPRTDGVQCSPPRLAWPAGEWLEAPEQLETS